MAVVLDKLGQISMVQFKGKFSVSVVLVDYLTPDIQKHPRKKKKINNTSRLVSV